MKLVAISDTHNRQKSIKEFMDIDNIGQDKEPLSGDIIVHAGDATMGGTVGECERFLEWYGSLNFKHVIFTPGNHDWLFERNPEYAAQLCKDNGIILLNDSGIEIDGVKFWGSPVQPWFFDWAFNRARDEGQQLFQNVPLIKPHWDMIPEGTNVLITHGPPYGILDYVPRGEFVGCKDLAYRINEIKPDLHIFGHIHHSAGQKHENGVSYYNVSVCNEQYQPNNAVTIIDYIK
jgi:Icc-related predicted phosphoesterase